jgi:hypothetical protein
MDPVFLNCKISLGAFSGERVFEVQQVSGEMYIGLSPLHYCFHLDGNMLGHSEPAQGITMPGKLAARKISVETKAARVAIPDGRAISVPLNLISERPLGGGHVPI